MRDCTRIESGYLAKPVPQQDRTEERYYIIPSVPLRQHYFDKTNFKEPDIVLGDWGVASWDDKHLTGHIQPVSHRAPEVLIKAHGMRLRACGISVPSSWNFSAQCACSAGRFHPMDITSSKSIWQRL